MPLINQVLRNAAVQVVFVAALLLVPAFSFAALPNGGDEIWKIRDQRAGKQTPAASVVDSQGNVIVVGSQIPPGGTEEFYTVKITPGGTVAWRGVYAKPGFNARATAVAVDANDNVFVTGNVSGANTDVYTIRYDREQAGPDAVPAWVQVFDGGGQDIATSLAARGGYVYVGGSSRYDSNESFMVLAYKDNGGSANLEWQVPKPLNATVGKARSLAVNASGIVVTGQSWSGTDLYFTTISYDLAGQKLWENRYLATGHQYADSGQIVKFDSLGHVVAAGYLSNGANSDMYTVKYCSSVAGPCAGKVAGDLLWEQIHDGGSEDEPNDLAIDGEAAYLDEVYVTGHSMADGRNHVYTVRYHAAPATPQAVWTATYESGADNTDIPAAVAPDLNGSLFVTGYTEAGGNADFLTIKYRKDRQSTDGELWVRHFAGVANKNDRAVGIGLDLAAGQLYVAGYADETAPLGGVSTATAGSSKSLLVDAAKNWTQNWSGYHFMMTGGANSGQFRPITASTPTTLTPAYQFASDIAVGDSYYIFDNDDLDYYVVKYEMGVLNAPTKLVATSAANGAIDLVWQDNNLVTPRFRVERCTTGSDHLLVVPCDFDNPAEITVVAEGITATATQDTTGLPDTYYYYRVRAYTTLTDFAHAERVTLPSNTAHAVTQAVLPVAPVGDHTYRYAGVASNDDYALSVATGKIDGHPVVSGKSFFDPGGFDYYTIRLDRGNLTKLWSQRYNDPEDQQDVATCLAVDNNNQLIVSGYSYLANFAFDPPLNMNSIYTIKYKADALSVPENDPAHFQWDHQYNGPGGTDDKAVSIATTADASNNIALVGVGVHSEADLSNHDIYVLHYPADGPKLTDGSVAPGYWAVPIDRGADDEPTAIAVDAAGDVIITGFTQKTTGDRKYDIYTAKFKGATGALLWERIYDGTHGDDMANDVTVDTLGNIYVTGIVTNSQLNWDYATIKYDRDGTMQWGGNPLVYDGPGRGDDEAVSVRVDPTSNDIVVAGNRLTDTGNNDFHVIRYTPAGTVVWQKTLLREMTDEEMIEMSMDSSGSVFITGTTTNGANPDPATNQDILTIKVDRAGTIVGNATVYGSTAQVDKPYGITTNYLGEAFVAGMSKNAENNADYIVLKIDGAEAVSPYPVTYTTPTYTSVILSWPPVAVTKGGHYHLQRQDGPCENNVSAATPLPDQPDTATSYTDTGLGQETAYCYSIQHHNGTTLSPWLPTTVVTPVPLPPSPVAAAAAGTTTVTVSWTPQNGGQQTGFDIWRCMDTGSYPCTDFALLQSVAGAATSYSDPSVCPGSIYRYQVRATGSGWTSSFSGTVGAIPPAVDNGAMDPGFEAPSPLTTGQGVGWTYVGGTIATDISFDSGERHGGAQSLKVAAVGTTSQSGIKQYVLFSPGGKYQLSAWFKTAAPAGKVVCDTLDGASFSFSNSGTTSDWEQITQTLAVTASVPATGSRFRCYVLAGATAYIDDLRVMPVYDLTATRGSEMQVDLAWIDSALDETGYSIERCADSAGNTPCADFVQVATAGANSSSYMDWGVTPDTTYRYRIRPFKTAPLSCNAGWVGNYSATASATTTVSLPVLTAAAPNTTRVNLVWTDTTANETQFQIERCTGGACVMPPPDASFPRPVASNTVSYSDTTVCSTTTYNYRLQAVYHGLSQDGFGKWTNKVKLDFGTPVSTFKPNLLTRMSINLLTGMDATFKDIRFYDATARRELPHWIEGISGTTANVWFKSGDNDDVYLYFGNGAATSTSSFAGVFGAGTVGYWPFNETAGTFANGSVTADASGNGQNGTLGNFTSGYGIVAGGRFGNGLSADGANDAVSIPDPAVSVLDITDAVTIELWYQYQTSPAWARIVSKATTNGGQPYDMYALWLDSSTSPGQVPYFSVGSTDSPPGSTILQTLGAPQLVPGQWYHLVGRYDSTTGILSTFVNGIEYGINNYPAKPKIGTNNMALQFGNRGSNWNPAKGIIDEVRIYNRALSNQEIASRYAATLPVVAVPLQSSVSTDMSGFVLAGVWDGAYSKPTAAASASAPSRVTTPTPANLVADPDMDNAPVAWGTAVGTATGTSFDAGASYSGSKSLKLTATGTTLGLSQTVAVVPGEQYVLSGYIKTALTAGNAQCDVYGTGIDSAGISSAGTSDWAYRTPETVTIPAGTTSVAIRCFANGAPQGQAWFDMVQFVPVVPVQSLTATRVSEQQVDLAWTFPANLDQTGFKIDRCADAACSTVLATFTVPTAATRNYNDTGLAFNASFWYRVRAYKTEDPSCNGGKGFWETPNSAIKGAATDLLPPAGLTGTSAVWSACEDIRITDSLGTMQNFYIEEKIPLSACDTTSTKFIAKVSSIPAGGKTLYLYHGNPLSTAVSNSSTVFNFFDDFEGTDLDLTKWAKTDWTGFSVSGGKLHGTNTTGKITSIAPYTYGAGYNVQALVKVQANPDLSPKLPPNGFVPVGVFTSWTNNAGWLHAPGMDYYSNNAAWIANPTTPPTGTAQTDSMIFSVVLKNATTFNPQIYDADKNVTYGNPGDLTQTIAARPIVLGQRYDGASWNNQSYAADWEWVRVRKFASPTPSAAAPGPVTVGPYSISGETGTWRFRRPVTIAYDAAGTTLADYQLNITTDTTALGTDRNTLSWTDTTATETEFKLERCKDTEANCTASFAIEKTIAVGAQSGVNATVTYVDKDTALSTSYCYRVKAVNPVWPGGETGPSGMVCVTTSTPAPPTNFKATGGTSSIALTWTDNTSGESGFTLERCKDISGDTPCSFNSLGNGNIVTLAVLPNDNRISTTAAYTDTTDICSGSYRYRITAYKDYADGTSWTRGPTYLDDGFVSTGLPAAPENVVATRVSEQEIKVTWTDKTADESGFEVWRCVGSTCTDFKQLAVSVAPSTSPLVDGVVTFNDTYLVVPGTTYRYQVRATIGGSCPTASAPSPANPGLDYATTTINPPTGIKATAVNTTQVDLVWADTTIAESGFVVRRCPGMAPCQTTYTDIAVTAAGATTYSDASACAGSVYNYTVAPLEHPTLPFGNSGGKVWTSLSPLSISNFKPDFITQVTITKGTDKDMQDDFRDIRFFDRDAQRELPYWIQSVSGTGSAAKAVVWFKTGATSGIDLYYGNPAATTASNRDGVFGTGLVGYWPFEEASQLTGTIADVSGSGINLTTTHLTSPNGIIAGGGTYGNALSLDGGGDYAYKSGAITGLPTGSVASVEAWVYPTGASLVGLKDYNGIVSWGARTCTGGGVALSLSQTGYPQVPTWCNDVQSSAPVTFNAWNHLVMAMNGRDVTFYLNGVPTTTSLANTPNFASQSLSIGTLEASGGGRFFKGLVDEVRIYNRTLTAQDIAARYAATLPVVTVGAKTGTGTPGPAAIAHAVTPTPGNLIGNHDFESGTSTWSFWPDSGGISFDTAVFFSGKQSLKMSRTLAANGAATTYKVFTDLVPGGSYLLTGYINASLSSGGYALCGLSNWAPTVNWGSPQMGISGADATKNNMGWFGFAIPITLPVTAPGGGSISNLNLECGITANPGGVNTARFDAVQLVPNPPIVLTATRGSEAEINLSWKGTFTDLTGYNIYRCQEGASTCSADGDFTKVTSVGGAIVTYRDSGLTPQQTYRYKVTAYKTAPASCGGGWESPVSTVGIASTTQLAPDLQSVTPPTATTMKLAWTDTTTTETGFNIERCQGSAAVCTGASPPFTELYHNVAVGRLIDEGLKARYSFNGNVNDSSGSGLNLTEQNGYTPTYEDGGIVRNSFYNFRSQSTAILDTDVHTIEFDIKFRSTTSTWYRLFGYSAGGSDRSPGIWNSGANRLYWRYNPGDKGINLGVTGDGGTPFVNGTWYRIRGVKNGGNFKVYVNENLVHESSNIVPAVKAAGPAMLEFGPGWGPDVVIKNFSIYSNVADPTLATFTDNQVCPETSYYYRVSANKEGDWGQGPTSNVRGNTTLTFNPPSGVTAKAVTDRQVDLAWAASPQNDQTTFVLKECPGTRCTTPVGIPNQTTYSSSGLNPETNYCYQVAAFKETAYCNGGAGITSVFVPADKCPTTFSARPETLTATALSPYKIRLDWYDESGDEDGFILETRIWNGQWITRKVLEKTDGTHNARQFIDTLGIEPLKQYVYRIRAFRGTDITPPSNEAVVTYTYPGGPTISTTPAFTGGDKSTCPCEAGKILVGGVCTTP